MTVAAAPSKIIYQGDGLTTVFGFSFPLPTDSDGSDVEVWVFDDVGNPTLLTGNYSVDVLNKTVSYPTVGGVAPLGPSDTALPATWELVINRVEPLEQLLQIIDQGIFDSENIELAFDKIVMILQQLQEQINRATLVGINTPGPGTPVSPPQSGTTGLLNITATYAQLKYIANLNPTQPMFGFATDLGATGQLMFYCGVPTAIGSDQGWYGPITGG